MIVLVKRLNKSLHFYLMRIINMNKNKNMNMNKNMNKMSSTILLQNLMLQKKDYKNA